MKRKNLLLLALLPLTATAQPLTQYVDPRIGTGDHGDHAAELRYCEKGADPSRASGGGNVY